MIIIAKSLPPESRGAGRARGAAPCGLRDPLGQLHTAAGEANGSIQPWFRPQNSVKIGGFEPSQPLEAGFLPTCNAQEDHDQLIEKSNAFRPSPSPKAPKNGRFCEVLSHFELVLKHILAR